MKKKTNFIDNGRFVVGTHKHFLWGYKTEVSAFHGIQEVSAHWVCKELINHNLNLFA